jgi:alkanesulfonate monooxygenase SsuD/methylene tetrahydromethanopterin reductase-like flavin-dependent oxidoreductase (luciferase family)
MPEEFEGVSASFPDRGAVTDEHIEMFKALCVGETAEYHGQHFQISGKVFYPKPLQKPHPPIWVGGRTRAAVRRTARIGDGWLPNGIGPDDLATGRRTLRRLCEESGRSADSVQVGNCLTVHFGSTPDERLGRTSLGGGVAEIVDNFGRFRDAGLDFAMVSFPAPSTETTLEAMRRFAVEVVPSL